MLSALLGFPWCSLSPCFITLSGFSMSFTNTVLPGSQNRGIKCCNCSGTIFLPMLMLIGFLGAITPISCYLTKLIPHWNAGEFSLSSDLLLTTYFSKVDGLVIPLNNSFFKSDWKWILQLWVTFSKRGVPEKQRQTPISIRQFGYSDNGR